MRVRAPSALPGPLLALGGVLLLLLSPGASPVAAQEGALQGLRGEYYEWDTSLGDTPDRADVFREENLRFTRIDPTVNFNWPTASPDADLRADGFAVRWTGQVVPVYSEDYTFSASSDDGVQLWISDKPINLEDPGSPIIDTAAWTVHGETAYDALEPMKLQAGKKYYVLLEMYEYTGGAVARLRWKSPSQPRQTVPAAQLIPAGVDASDTTAPAAITDLQVLESTASSITLTWSSPGGDAARYDVRCGLQPITEANWTTAQQWGLEPRPGPAGTKETFKASGLDPIQRYFVAIRTIDRNFNVSAVSPVIEAVTKGGDIGDGLKGDYYILNRTELTDTPERSDVFTPENLKLTRIDSSVNFGWAAGVPATGIRADGFAVRWTGMVLSPVSEDVTFYAAADDGVRLWVDEKPIDPDSDAPIAESWIPQAEAEFASDPIALQAGKQYHVVMEMYEAGGDAAARLRWSSASLPKQIIPPAYLFSSSTPIKMGRVSGTVLDQNQQSLGRATLNVTAVDRTLRVQSDSGGFFTFLAPQGKVDITVTVQGMTKQVSTDVKGDEIVPLNVVIPTGPAVTLGDLTGDGKVGVVDAIQALQVVANLKQATADQVTAGDINKNGRIDTIDVIRILRAVAGLEPLS